MNWKETNSQTLFKACYAREDSDAWNEFVRRYQDLIARTALRIASRWIRPSPELVADLIQQTHLRLLSGALNKYKEIRPDSDFGFIKVVTANVVTDHFRASAAATVPLDAVSEPLSKDEGVEQTVLFRQIRNALEEIISGPTSKRDRCVFLLYYRQGLSAREIADIPGIGLSVKGVEALLGRLVAALRKKLSLSAEISDDKINSPQRDPAEDDVSFGETV